MFQTEKQTIDKRSNYGGDWYKMKQRIINVLFGFIPDDSLTPAPFHLVNLDAERAGFVWGIEPLIDWGNVTSPDDSAKVLVEPRPGGFIFRLLLVAFLRCCPWTLSLFHVVVPRYHYNFFRQVFIRIGTTNLYRPAIEVEVSRKPCKLLKTNSRKFVDDRFSEVLI